MFSRPSSILRTKKCSKEAKKGLQEKWTEPVQSLDRSKATKGVTWLLSSVASWENMTSWSGMFTPAKYNSWQHLHFSVAIKDKIIAAPTKKNFAAKCATDYT